MVLFEASVVPTNVTTTYNLSPLPPHCRYCNQVLSKEIDESVTLLLQELVRFQERVYQKDPTKAKSKRRLVMGLREVTKHMKLHKIKCVIISPNCEKIQAKGESRDV